MYICYIDESGHCGKKLNPEQPVEVLCGVLTDVTKLFKTQREHANLLQLLKDNGIPLSELKAADAYRGRKHWTGIEPGIRDTVFQGVFAWLNERSCRFIVCPIDTRKFFDLKASGCPLSNSFNAPYEAGAINILLGIERIQASKKKNKGKTLVVFDEQNGHDENMLRLLSGDLAFTDPYTGYTPRPRARVQEPRLQQVIDVPHFSKSHLSVLIQLADWAAFVVNRYLLLTVYGEMESYVGELEKIEGWYQAVGGALVPHTAIDPPGKEDICLYFRQEVRPDGWSAKKWRM
jgi:hypothetical protein